MRAALSAMAAAAAFIIAAFAVGAVAAMLMDLIARYI